MTAKRGKKLSDYEKDDFLSKTLEILKCGDKEIIDAFSAEIEALAEVCRSGKKIKEIIKKRAYHPPDPRG
jgi:hypothetical protein